MFETPGWLCEVMFPRGKFKRIIFVRCKRERFVKLKNILNCCGLLALNTIKPTLLREKIVHELLQSFT